MLEHDRIHRARIAGVTQAVCYSIRTLLVVALSVLSLAGAVRSSFAQETGRGVSDRAVSLRVLQQTLRQCRPRDDCSRALVGFAGLTRVTGYVVDRDNRDVIVVGEVEPGRPLLDLDDFVVALRNAWHRYVERKGHTIYYSAPSCSIDPEPAVPARTSAGVNSRHATHRRARRRPR